MIRLTKEEIKGKWHTTSYEPKDDQISYSLNDIRDRILEAQIKKLAEWGKELCIGHGDEKWKPTPRCQCIFCWQSLLEEVK